MGEEFNFTNDDIRTEQERVQDDIQDINNEYYDVNYQIIYAQIVNNALTQNSLRCKSSGEVAKWISDNGEIEIKETVEEITKLIDGLSPNETNKLVKSLYSKTGKTNYVKQSYMTNYKVAENDWYDDIRFLNGLPYKNKVDILVGGSPCQSFSIIGKRAGLDDTRGTLFYDFARLVKEIEPKVFIYENVPGILTHDKGNTWEVISSVFNSLGYKVYEKLLNSKDYGIPHDRKRLFVIGFKDHKVDFNFPKPIKLTKKMFDYLDDDVEVKHYLGKKGFEFVTNPKYKNRARVNPEIIQTQKANQQFNWNGDFVFVPYEKNQG